MAKKQYGAEAASAIIRTTFDGLPIVDAVANFTLIVRDEQIKAAKGHEKDAANCILAKACRKQVGASRVAFFRQIAYLDLPDNKGQRKVVRFSIGREARAIIEAFDRGKNVKGEVAVTLHAPPKSKRLDKVLAESRRAKARLKEKRKALLRGEIIDSAPRSGASRHRVRVVGVDVRSGIGMVHNTLKKPSRKTVVAGH